MKYYLAIDIGASSGRHIVAHLENGKMITEEIYRFQNGPKEKIAYDNEQHLTWESERLFTEILNGLKKAKELGKVRSEGKEYVMKDGDVVLFRFNV